jgi:outer membrane PBP1 activator LpoA protein
MRQSLFALATAAFLLAACGGSPKTSTPGTQSTTVTAAVGSPVTASGKMRIALLLPLSGRSAPVGQSLQQAAEMALFDTGAKELALAAYDSGETADTAV